jgi:hypothetical protein
MPITPKTGSLFHAYSHRFAQEASWREDNKRMANGTQVDRLVALAMNSAKSADFCGYWQRHVKAA